uniref:non-specific serine/threonine protein kinase n=1 Tax=Haliotis discus hannai TaxID=42344 RepID=A0A9E9FVE2_HALDH|nr:eIF-2-alpha kinase GCN2 [Haliotis discus hannai]
MASQSLSERQEDEIQALLSIFMDDASDLREQDAWKVQRPPEIKLTLRPQESMGGVDRPAYAQVDLIVRCSCSYPDDPPDVHLENPKGLSNNQLSSLREELKSLSKKLVGEVMIHELAQHVQWFLHTNNKPPTQSFYDEMMENKRKQEEMVAQEQMKKMELQRRKEEKERQNIEDEVLRKQAALRIEVKKRRDEIEKDNKNNSMSEPTTPSSEAFFCSPIQPLPQVTGRDMRRSSESPVSSRERQQQMNGNTRRQRRTSTPKRTSEEGDNRHKTPPGGVMVLAFNTKGERTVQRGMCLEHNPNGSTLYAGMDTNTGTLVSICEWVLKWRHFANKTSHIDIEEDKDATTYMKQIHSIEQELMSLIRLHHPNLVNYLAMRYQQDPGKITVHMLSELAGGHSLENYLKKNQAMPMELMRSYTDELLLAVEYLHNKAVVHKDLRASSVFVDFSGKIRLADFSINKRLSDLYETVEQARPGVHFQDIRPSVIGKGGKKADIFQLGLMVLSLAEGQRVQDIQPVIPTTLPAQLHDFLTKCLMQDERHRWSASQLLDHNFLKEPLPGTIPIRPADQERFQKDTKEQNQKEDEEDNGCLPYVHVTALEATGQSRLTGEFEILKSLGRGGFGDVIKVKNKLDGRMYAIKRIPLNPKSKQFNKKITREVKLLSRLNHENVVRYYNSWIEVSEEPAQSDTSSSYTSKTTDSSQKKSAPSCNNEQNSFDVTDDIEREAPKAIEGSMEWSVSLAFDTACQKCLASDSDDDDEDEQDVFGKSFLPVLDNSDSIVFETDSTSQPAVKESELSVKNLQKQETASTNTQESLIEIVPKLQYLYIQMEYCEKSTLRNCIDAGLYQDVTRVWRLFREIVEGLIHIHEQGMIHRDLKPVNIFLDSNDHVKIGDFGLATTDIITKSGLLDASLPQTSYSDTNFLSSSRSGSLGDGNMTGQVGTALYVSPEVMSGGDKLHYDQKVDIYSLGIIFFEMCYKPLPTGMERVKILGMVRGNVVFFPEDFDEIEMANQASVMRWLLNHDPSRRPTSKELLQSDYMPPPQMEEAELNEILRSTIANPQSKAYHRMMEAVFGQQVSPASDLSYDLELVKGMFTLKSSQLQMSVHNSIERVFELHGGTKVATPFLMPQSDLYKSNDQYVRLMDHSGGLIGLPYDLRVPFARYIARNNILNLKRFSLERVFREKKFFGLHPREMTECAFDIITPTPGSLIPDAEVLVIVQHCIKEFPSLHAQNCYIRMNHHCLLRAVLLHCGIPDEKHKAVLSVLAEVQFNKMDRQTALESLSEVSLTESSLATLTQLLDLEGQYGKVASILRIITKTKGQASTLAKQGLHEIEAVTTHATFMGLKLPIVVTVGLMYNHLQYSGIIFQVLRDVKRKRKSAAEVLAAGGRYDKMIQQFASPLHPTSHIPSGVGVSIAFEKIVAAITEDLEPPSPYDVLVCTIGCKPMLKERLAVAKDLWLGRLKTQVLFDTMQSPEEISDYCRELGVSHMVILKDADTGSVKVRSIEKDRVTERKVPMSEVVDFLQQKQQFTKQESMDMAPGNEKKSNTGQSSNYSETNQSSTNSSSNNITFNFLFVMQEGRITSNIKRKYESQMFNKLSSALQWLPGKSHDVIVVELNKAVLSIIAAYLEVNGSEADFDASISSVIEKQPRHRKYLTNIMDEIHTLKFEKRCQFIILYGLKDDTVKLVS